MVSGVGESFMFEDFYDMGSWLAIGNGYDGTTRLIFLRGVSHECNLALVVC